MQEVVLSEKSIPKSFKNWYLKTFKEAHENRAIDVVHEYDRGISVEENKAMFLEKFSSLVENEIKLLEMVNLPKKELEFITEEKEQKELLQQQQKVDEEYKEILEQIKTTPTPNISKITWKIREFIKLVLNDKTEKHTIIIVGKQGTGKTNTIKSVLKEFFTTEQLAKIIKNGHTSPLSYYNMLYDNPQGIFFWDDLSGLYKSETGISLLKQTAETEKKRLVCYSSTTGKLEHRNTSFFFEGSQILCMNTMPRSREFMPILSRIRPIVFNPNYNEILLMMFEIIKERYDDVELKEKIGIVEFIQRNTSPATENFDLRLLSDFIDLYRHCGGINDNFREMSKCLIETDVDKELVLELSRTKSTITEQEKEFKMKTNKSRATFYLLRKELGIQHFYNRK